MVHLRRRKYGPDTVLLKLATWASNTLLSVRPFVRSSFLSRFLNDQEISDGGNFSLGEKDSVYRLDIGSVDSDLVGKLKVTAENENGKDEKEVRNVTCCFPWTWTWSTQSACDFLGREVPNQFSCFPNPMFLRVPQSGCLRHPK